MTPPGHFTYSSGSAVVDLIRSIAKLELTSDSQCDDLTHTDDPDGAAA